MTTIIFENKNISKISSEGLNFLRKNICQCSYKKRICECDIDTIFKFYDDSNVQNDIINEYNNGSRKFVLNILSSQIVDLFSIIYLYNDAIFISGTSTVTSLRNKLSNLFFSLPTENSVSHFAYDHSKLNSCLIYDHEEDIYVQSIIQVFADNGVPVFSIKNVDLSKPLNLIVTSIGQDIINKILDLIPKDKSYHLFIVEFTTPINIIYPSNIKSVTTISPKPTINAQINSYWNKISTQTETSQKHPSASIIPLCIKLKKEKLTNFFKVSTNLYKNSSVMIRYLPLYPSLNVKIIDPYKLYKYNKCIVWLFRDINDNDKFNIEFTKKNNNNIKIIEKTTNFQKSYNKYYSMGYRYFIFDDTDIGDIKTAKDVFIICPRIFNHYVRDKYNNFAYTMCDDVVVVSNYMIAEKNVSDGNLYVVLGQSYKYLESVLVTLDVKFGDIHDFDKIPNETIIIDILGNNEECTDVLNNIYNNRNKYNKITLCRKYFEYFSDTQINILNQININNDSVFSLATSQPFLDSYYSLGIIPKKLKNTSYFDYANLTSPLYDLDPNFLHRFGYIV